MFNEKKCKNICFNGRMKLSLLKSLIFYFLNKSLIHVSPNTHEREAAARVRSSISTLTSLSTGQQIQLSWG